MTTDSIEISQKFADKGMDKNLADVVAVAIAKHNDENFATKVDISRLERKIDKVESNLIGEIKLLAMQVKIVLGLLIALIVGFIVKFL